MVVEVNIVTSALKTKATIKAALALLLLNPSNNNNILFLYNLASCCFYNSSNPSN